MNRRQQEVIEYLKEENRVLREKLGRKRFLLSLEQKRRLAAKGKVIGSDLLRQFGALFSPDTILKWQCCLKTPKQSPKLNAYAESWVRNVKRECLKTR